MKKSILFLIPLLILGLGQTSSVEAKGPKDLSKPMRFKGLKNPDEYSTLKPNELKHELSGVQAKIDKYEEYITYYQTRLKELTSRKDKLTNMGVTAEKKAVTEKKKEKKEKPAKAEKEAKKAKDTTKKKAK